MGYFQASQGREDILYITSSHPFSSDDLNLVRLFCQNVSIAYENAILREEIEGTQRDIVYMLGEAIETRSKETGQHVRRVAEYCHLIAIGMGFSERMPRYCAWLRRCTTSAKSAYLITSCISTENWMRMNGSR